MSKKVIFTINDTESLAMQYKKETDCSMEEARKFIESLELNPFKVIVIHERNEIGDFTKILDENGMEKKLKEFNGYERAIIEGCYIQFLKILNGNKIVNYPHGIINIEYMESEEK